MKRVSLYDPFTGQENIGELEKKLFLISPAYCNMLRKMVVGLTADHSLTVALLPPNHPQMGFTDGVRIMINTLHQLFVNEPIEKNAEYCLALAVHESLHPIYSNFQCIQDAARKRPKETDNTVQIRRDLLNILEDARIERIGAFRFPGVAYAIVSLNEFLFSQPKELEKMKDIEKMLTWILDFVSVGRNRGELEGDLALLWEKVKPLAEKAKYSDTCSDCYLYTKKIMRLIKPLIPEQDPIDQQQQKTQNMKSNDKDVDANTKQQPPQPDENGQGGGSDQNQQAQNGGNPSGADPQNGRQQKSGQKKLGQQNSGQAQGSGQQGNGQSQPANSSGTGSSQGGGQQGGGYGDAAPPDGSALEEMLTRALNNSYNEHLKDESDNKADASTVANLQRESTSGFNVVPYFGDYRTLEQYNLVKEQVMPIANHLRTGLKNIINYNVDEMSRYLHAGRIDAKSLSRMPSGAICAKRIEKSDEADLNITVLVDLSGSMGGIRIESAIKSCVILQEVCMALKIPITVLGFKAGTKTGIYHFSNHKMRGRYAHTGIVRMSAGGGTPLYEAMQYLPSMLTSQKEEDKLLLIITDGVPNGGPDPCAIAVKKLSQYAKVYGLAIGDGKEVLTRIFGSKCILIDRLERLPGELCKIIEKNMLRR